MKPTSLVMPFLAAFCLLALPAQGQEAKTGSVVAKIDGESIVMEQVMRLFRNLPRRQQELGLDSVYRDLLERLIVEHLLLVEARKEKLNEGTEFKQLIAEARDEIMRSLIRRRIIETEVNEKAVRRRYEKLKDSFRPGDEVSARHILLRTKDEAKEVIERLKDGEDFSVLARQLSIGPSRNRGGALGYFRKNEMVKPFAEAAFDMKPGSYSSEPIETEFGWHVIRVDDRREARLASFEVLADQIEQALAREAIGKYATQLKEGTQIRRYSLDGRLLQAAPDGSQSDKR